MDKETERQEMSYDYNKLRIVVKIKWTNRYFRPGIIKFVVTIMPVILPGGAKVFNFDIF